MNPAVAFFKRIQRLQDRLTPPTVWRWPILVLAGFLSSLGWSLLGLLVQSQSIRLTLTALGKSSLWLTALFWGLALLAVVFLSHSLLAGNLAVGVPSLILAFVNHYKELITSTPLTIGDFTLIGQVGHIAGLNKASLTLTRNSVLAIVGAVLWLIVIWFFSRPLRVRWRWSLLGAPVCALVFFLLFWVGANPLVFTPLGVEPGKNIPQAAVNQRCGVPLGLWRSLHKSMTKNQDIGGDYAQEPMERVAAQAEAYAGDPPAVPEREKPNVIMILSESFFDVTTLDGVTYDEDPVADFHALRQESVSGAFYTRTLGYGTCSIELEILTGLNTGLLSSEDLSSLDDPTVFTRIPSIPALLRSNGYYTSMMHTFNDSIYHRERIFPYLGFDDLYFSDSFAQFYPPAAQAADYWDYMATRVSGEFYSDDLLSDLLIAQYEAMSDQHTGPLFLYASSMENHQPYPEGKYSDEELTVHPTSNLTGEAAASLLQYSQGAANASAALGKLVDYFRTCDEPVVIIFYGDHRPGFGLSHGGTVYSELGMVSSSRGKWSLADLAKLYSTDYLIWSNDPAYLPGEPGSTLDTSCHYFGTLLLDITGVETPTYWNLIRRLSQYRLVDVVEFHLSTAGELTASPPDSGPGAEGLSLLTDIMNDAIYGKQYITGLISGSNPG